jgi:hypothetical protein
VRLFIPRSAPSRRERGYACLIRRVSDNPTAVAFDGKYFRCGAAIDESELSPDEEWPSTPLLLEYAGLDYAAPLQRLASGYGGKRRPLVHILWRYERDRREWRELARASSVDNDWVQHFVAIARVEMLRNGRPAAPVDIAVRASVRWIEALDRELSQLENEERVIALGLLYEQITARVVDLGEVGV